MIRYVPTVRKIESLVPLLLKWFSQNARDLPWRRTSDPYAIWISEIMLQQTQVKTVIPYWECWMQTLPTLDALAVAPLDRVLKLWEGLGYYTRARNLQLAARTVVRDHGGVFPNRYEAVLALPGIGRYTAGAICSIAFHQPTPILDGNVIRVLTRLFAIEGSPRERAVNEPLWRLAEALVRAAARGNTRASPDCSHLNQSLMELGATVCTPRDPDCPACPVQRHCQARRQGRVLKFPKAPPKKRSTPHRVAAFVIRCGNRYLVRQRAGQVVNGGLWEFPNVEIGAALNLPAVARQCLGFLPTQLAAFHSVRHTITHSRITLEVFAGSTRKTRGRGAQWLSAAELPSLAFPSAHRRILVKLLSRDSTGP